MQDLDLLIVTGASKGIGKSIVDKCKNNCKNIILISSSGTDVYGAFNIKIDIGFLNDVREIIHAIVSKLGDIKSVGIVLCAGQIGEPSGLLDAKLADWEDLFSCNVLGNLAVIQGIQSLIKDDLKLRIVFFGGGGAGGPFPEFFGYSLTKTAVIRAVENLSIELSNLIKDVCVIALAPGAIATDMLQKTIDSGKIIKEITDISVPTNFVYNFLFGEKMRYELFNGCFVNVKDDIDNIDFSKRDILKLRRID